MGRGPVIGRRAMMPVVETIETAEDAAITALFAEIRAELGVPSPATIAVLTSTREE